jgi:hypothetical protein
MTEFYNHVVYQNFLAPRFENTLLLKNGGVFTENSLKVVGIDSFINFYRTVYENSCLALETTPHLVCTGCGSLKQLENLIYDQDIVEYLNQSGLAIYLYEDVYTSVGPKIKNYLEGPPLQGDSTEYYKRYGPSIRGFESTVENLKTLYCFELESIKRFIDNNNLSNVTVYCCDYRVEKYLQQQYSSMKVKTRNIFLITAADKIIKSNQHKINTRTSNLITHKFLSANGKYKAVRHLTSAYLLDKSSILSFDQSKSIWGSLQNQLWFNLASWNNTNPKIFSKLMTNMTKLETMPPMSIGNAMIPNPNFETEFDFAPQGEYERCFCSVICETKYSHPVASFSEKTLNSIYRYRPFILIAPPYTLEYLKHYGFKTFGSYWDESYDKEENHEKRLLKIFKLIDYIDNLPLTTLRNLYQSMMPILEHNYNVIKTVPKAWPL